MSPLQRTLKHLLGALVIVGLFRLLILPGNAPAFDVQSFTFLYPWQSRATTGIPVQRLGSELDASVPVADQAPDLLPFGLLQLADGIDPIVDIVAIHGLDGHREESWKAKDGVLWLRDLLPKKIPRARILSYGYDANTRGHEQLSVETLDGHAIALVSKLALKREETSTKERPIIFVAHSLGGIILKNALIHAYSTNTNHLNEHKAIDLSTYGILFLGTPHQGSESASLATLFLNIWGIVGQTNDAMVKHIEKDSEALQQQLSRYLSISAQFHTKFFYESYRTPLVSGIKKLIVPKSSAVVPGAVNAEPIPINKDHTNMVKFASADDEDFKAISSHLSLMVQAAPTKIVTNWRRYHRANEEYDHRTTTQKRPCLPRKLGYERDNSTFFGRERELEMIHKSFMNHHIVAIHGLGGIGKTRLAVEYIYSHERDYNAIFWANADTNDTLSLSFVAIAQQLVDCESRISSESALSLGTDFTSMARHSNLTDNHGTILTNVTDRVVSKVISWLSDSVENWLLVLDNADDLDNVDLRSFFPNAASRKILITSRNPISSRFSTGHEILSLTEDAAVQLLLQKAGKEGEGEDETARQIVQNLKYFPLAIEQAGAYISMLQLDLTSYIEEYQRDETLWKQVLERKLPGPISPYRESIFTTWEVSHQAVERRNQYAAHLLGLCGFLGAEDIPEDLFQTGLANSDVRFNDALEQLFSFSLAKRVAGGRSFSMHSLVQTWARERLDREHRAIIAKEVVRLLGAKLASFGGHTPERRKFELKVASHIAACVENAMHLDALRYLIFRWTGLPYLPSWAINAVNYGILQIFRYPDHAFVRLLDEIATTCDRYNLQCAKDLRQVTLEWSINVLGPYDFWTLRRMTSLGKTLGKDEPSGDGMALILHALERHETIQGITHQTTIRNVGTWSGIDLTLSKFGHVVGAFQRFLYGKAIHDPNRITTHVAVDHLANAKLNQGKFEEAQVLYRRLLEYQENLLGANHSDTLEALADVALTNFKQEKFEEAEVLYRRLLERRENLLGADHSDTLTALYHVALTNLEQEKFEEAEISYRRLLKYQERLLGPEHDVTLTTLIDLSFALTMRDMFVEAEQLFKHVLHLLKKNLEPPNPTVLHMMHHLGFAILEQNRFKEAEGLLRRALEGWEKIADTENVFAVSLDLGTAMLRQGSPTEAEGLLRHAFEGFEEFLGPNDHQTLLAISNLGVVTFKLGKFEEAERLCRCALERWEQNPGPDNAEEIATLSALASVILKQGKVEEARRLFQRTCPSRAREH